MSRECMLKTFKIVKKTSRGFEPRSLDSESRALTVTPRGRLHVFTSALCVSDLAPPAGGRGGGGRGLGGPSALLAQPWPVVSSLGVQPVVYAKNVKIVKKT